MTKLPPSPEIGLLRVPLPDLNAPRKPESVVRASSEERENRLQNHPEPGGAAWSISAAIFARDQGRFDEALGLCRQALHRAFLDGDKTRTCSALEVQVTVLALKGDFATASQLVAHLDTFSEGDTGFLRGLYDEAAGTVHLRTIVQDWFAEARDHYRSALEHYKAADDARGQMRCYAGLASAFSGIGTYLASTEQVDAGLHVAAAADDWMYVGRLLTEAALALRDQGYRTNVAALFQLAIDWATYVGDRPTRIRALHGLAYLYDFEANPGDPADMVKSEAVFFQAIDEANAIGALPLVVAARLDLLHLYQKYKQDELLQKQQALVNQDAARLSLSPSPRWLDSHDNYKQWIEDLRSDRYYARLREAIEGVSDPFFIFDPIIGANGACEDLLNEFRNSAADRLCNFGPMVVRTLADLLQTPYVEGLREPLLRAVSDRQPYEDEISTEDPVAGTVWFTRRILPAGDGAVLTLRNSTDTRNVQEALRRAAESARQADRAKSEFLANMSHEVRTPINGVLGLAKLLADSDLDDTQRTYVEGITASGDTLLRVIGDVLDLSKIEAQSMEVEPGPTNVHKMLGEVVGLFQGEAQRRNIDLIGWVATGVPEVVMLDNARVRQILGNLIGNAVKFTNAGSVRVSLRAVGEFLEFQVQDTGIGISQDRHSTIFEPFRQVGSALQKAGGTGLGLTISKRLVELMNGSISVASDPTVGSTFKFKLPLRRATEAAPIDAPATEEPFQFEGCRILVVEDNPVNVIVAKGLLGQLGCEVWNAMDGEEALEQVDSGEFDLILMDIRLPTISGLEVTEAIRRRESDAGKKRIPIIALTAGTLFEEREACFRAGVDDYLAKPFTAELLQKTLRKWLEVGKG